DIALLRSLRIHVALVHGAAHQIRRLAEMTGQTPSNLDGTGITDAVTLQLAVTAAYRVSHELLEGLSATDLRAACSNALVAHPAGILGGVDYQWSGRIERVDAGLLRALLERDIVPVIPPDWLRRRLPFVPPQFRRRGGRGRPGAAGGQAD